LRKHQESSGGTKFTFTHDEGTEISCKVYSKCNSNEIHDAYSIVYSMNILYVLTTEQKWGEIYVV